MLFRSLGDVVVNQSGTVAVSTDVPPEVLKTASRVDVVFDGVFYSSEKLFVVS